MKKQFYILMILLSPLFLIAQNVGIGTGIPLMKLHIAQTDSSALLLENTQLLIPGASTSLNFKIGSGNFPYTGAIKTIGTAPDGTFPTARLGLFTFTNSSPNLLIERMSILDNGNVGIGNIDPQNKLVVNGGATVNSLNLNLGTINNMSDPISDQDAATKAYVDAAAGGGGLGVYDGNGVKLGDVTNFTGNGTTISMLTSTGHLITLRLDGTIKNGQIYYSDAGCTGTPLLNAGGSGAPPIWAKTVVYSGSFSSLMVATGAGANGAVSPTTMIVQSIDNPDCGSSSGTKDGWSIIQTTPAAVGLPGYPLVTPIDIHN